MKELEELKIMIEELRSSFASQEKKDLASLLIGRLTSLAKELSQKTIGEDFLNKEISRIRISAGAI